MQVTREMVEQLSNEAGEHGDYAQVDLCAAALEGDESAWAKCVAAIASARAQDDPKTLRLYWDNQAGVEPGWYCEVLRRDSEGDLRHEDDSMKVGFSVDLDEFTRDQEDEVRAALLEEFPGAEWL